MLSTICQYIYLRNVTYWILTYGSSVARTIRIQVQSLEKRCLLWCDCSRRRLKNEFVVFLARPCADFSNSVFDCCYYDGIFRVILLRKQDYIKLLNLTSRRLGGRNIFTIHTHFVNGELSFLGKVYLKSAQNQSAEYDEIHYMAAGAMYLWLQYEMWM